MGIFKSLLSSVKDKITESILDTSEPEKEHYVASENTVTARELVLLSVAEKYKVGEKKYPEYFRTRYGIESPRDILRGLAKKDLLRPSTDLETLSRMKASELKDIAARFELTATGKKEELCNRIANSASAEQLEALALDRFWALTESGTSMLTNNPYVGFYMEKHPYSLAEIGLDFDTYTKLFSKKQTAKVRDVVWAELNRRSVDYYKKAMSKKEFHNYCELLRVMALFLEEEGKHADGLAMYMRYMHYRTNFEAGYAAVSLFSLTKKADNAAETLFIDAEILPFIVSEITLMSDACGFDSKQLAAFMKKAFKQEQDTGLFSPEELTDFIMCGIDGDQRGEKQICKKVMKAAAKRL